MCDVVSSSIVCTSLSLLNSPSPLSPREQYTRTPTRYSINYDTQRATVGLKASHHSKLCLVGGVASKRSMYVGRQLAVELAWLTPTRTAPAHVSRAL
eukprot:5978802-Prymnesium_polylepis.1